MAFTIKYSPNLKQQGKTPQIDTRKQENGNSDSSKFHSYNHSVNRYNDFNAHGDNRGARKEVITVLFTIFVISAIIAVAVTEVIIKILKII